MVYSVEREDFEEDPDMQDRRVGPYGSTNLCNSGGHAVLANDCVEFLALLKGCEEGERFAVGCYRSTEFVKLRRILKSPAPSYVRIRRQFDDSFYDLAR